MRLCDTVEVKPLPSQDSPAAANLTEATLEIPQTSQAPALPGQGARDVSPQGERGSSLTGRLFFCLLLLGLYWLYGWRPFQVDAELIVDDFLHIRHAHAVLNWLQGRSPAWLGPFDYLCLAKAPLYGVWLALLNILGIPLRVGEFLLLLAGPFWFERAVRPVTRLVGWRFALVVVLLVANPLFPGDFRPHRDGLQICLTNL
jgi:hypothetical protein